MVKKGHKLVDAAELVKAGGRLVNYVHLSCEICRDCGVVVVFALSDRAELSDSSLAVALTEAQAEELAKDLAAMAAEARAHNDVPPFPPLAMN